MKLIRVPIIELKLSEIGRLAVHGLAKLPGCTKVGNFKHAGIIFHISVERKIHPLLEDKNVEMTDDTCCVKDKTTGPSCLD